MQTRPENSQVWERDPFDHYVEEEWCNTRLFDVEKFNGAIHDPCCGFGRIPRAATRAGYMALGTDVADRGVLSYGITGYPYNWLGAADNIVSNPPFDIFEDVATHALKIAREKVALLWLVRRLPAARWLRNTPLVRVWWLTPRPSMPPGSVISHGTGIDGTYQKVGGGKQDFCWLVFDKRERFSPVMGWLHRDEGPKPTTDRITMLDPSPLMLSLTGVMSGSDNDGNTDRGERAPPG
jgi:hypothetical protein